MTILKKTIANVGSIGVIKDTLDFLLPQEAWTSALNMRPDVDVMRSIPFDEVISHNHNGQIHYLEHIRAPLQDYIFGGATNDAYLVEDNTTLYGLTPAGGLSLAASTDYWTGGYGTVPVFNISGFDYAPWVWDLNTANPLTALPNWPASTYANVIGVHGNFIVAGDIEETGSHFPELFWNSDAAAPGTAPSTWDHTDATKRARRQDMADSGGAIKQFLTVGGVLLTYKSSTSWISQIIGGNNVFSHKQFAQDIGVHGPRHAVQFMRGQVFAVGQQGIITHDLVGNTTSIMHKRMQKWIDSHIEPTLYARGFVINNSNSREVWYFFPTVSGDARCYTALVWNYRDNTTYLRDVHENSNAALAGTEAAIVANWTSDSAAPTFADFASIAIDDMTFPIGEPAAFPYRQTMLTWANDRFHVQGSALEAYARETKLERTGQLLRSAIDEETEQPVSIKPYQDKHITNIELDLTGVTGDTVTVEVGWQDELNGEVLWDEKQTFLIGERNDVDFETSGKIPCFRFSATKAWALHAYTVSFFVGGDHQFERG
jgi:hypothetical protein